MKAQKYVFELDLVVPEEIKKKKKMVDCCFMVVATSEEDAIARCAEYQPISAKVLNVTPCQEDW
jgi:hypothetical protein